MPLQKKFKTTMGSHIPIVPSSFKNLIYIFTSLKCTKFKLLNILGLQIFRYLFGKTVTVIKKIKYKKKTDLHDNYDEIGYQIFKDIIPQKDFLKVKNEFDQIIKEKSVDLFSFNSKKNDSNGDQILQNSSVQMFAYEFDFDGDDKNNYPEMYKVYKNEIVNSSFQFAEKKKNPVIKMRLERMLQLDNEGVEFNRLWHIDTFHETHKGFLYLTDVKDENGPFTYLKGSHKFSLRHLFMEYINSVKFSFNRSSASFRLFDHLSKFSENKKIQMICEPNTFVIANTHGFHRRGDAKKGMIRDSIAFWSRENPFIIN